MLNNIFYTFTLKIRNNLHLEIAITINCKETASNIEFKVKFSNWNIFL